MGAPIKRGLSFQVHLFLLHLLPDSQTPSHPPPPLPSIFLSTDGANPRDWRTLGVPVGEGGKPQLQPAALHSVWFLQLASDPERIHWAQASPLRGRGTLTPSPQTCTAATTTKLAPPWEGQTDRKTDRLESSPPLALRLPLSDLNSLRFNPHRQVRIKFKTGFSRSPAAAGREPAPRLVSTRPRGGGRAPFAFIFLLPLKWARFTSRLPLPLPAPSSVPLYFPPFSLLIPLCWEKHTHTQLLLAKACAGSRI